MVAAVSVAAGETGDRTAKEPVMETKSGPATGKQSVLEMLESPPFRRLVKRRWLVSSVLSLLLFVLYYGYILLIGYDKELLSTRIGEYTTLAIPMGVGVIVLSWILTVLYVVWANRSYDPEVSRLKAQLK
jgi:uncharacterized membrane protein (DUF485 family)